MANSTTSKIADAISLLSDALSQEVAHREGPVFEDDNEDETVPKDDHDDLKSAAEDFATEVERIADDAQFVISNVVEIEDTDDEDVDYNTESWNTEEPDVVEDAEVDAATDTVADEGDDTDEATTENIDALSDATADAFERIAELETALRETNDELVSLVETSTAFIETISDI
jgi:hypothetical protein|tara:strand:+ start:191 stop:709 length:519 start_codon:yes stop_codon:yes gene_type:complete